jgi:hypothetical protein
MESKVASLRREYQNFKRGKADVLAVRSEAVSVLEEANRLGDQTVVDEIEDLLIDLQFSMEEDRCRCHRRCSSC